MVSYIVALPCILIKMATVLQDADLLARIGGGDIKAIEAKYHHGCLIKYKNKYRSKQRASRQDSVISEGNLVNAQVIVELLSFIEDSWSIYF